MNTSIPFWPIVTIVLMFAWILPAIATERKILFYRHPMDPSILSPSPAKDSMGMDYIPVYAGSESTASKVPGQALVSMTPEIEQQIGATTAVVEKRELTLLVQTAARVIEKTRIEADVLDLDAPLIHSGQAVELTSSALPGQRFEGTVFSLESAAHAFKARIDSTSPLRPGLFLSAVIRVPLGRTLSIPESALIDTGMRQLVYVEISPGTFEPRPVRVGQQTQGYIEILDGLRRHERVVVSANFLIDSESRIQAAAQNAVQGLR